MTFDPKYIELPDGQFIMDFGPAFDYATHKRKPHIVTVKFDRTCFGGLFFEVSCPYDPSDPHRSCRCFIENPNDDVEGHDDQGEGQYVPDLDDPTCWVEQAFSFGDMDPSEWFHKDFPPFVVNGPIEVDYKVIGNYEDAYPEFIPWDPNPTTR